MAASWAWVCLVVVILLLLAIPLGPETRESYVKLPESPPILDREGIPITIQAQDGFRVFNPNFVKHNGKFYTVVRAHDDKHSYGIVLVETEGGGKKEIVIDPVMPASRHDDEVDALIALFRSSCPTGMEDPRIFVHNDNLWLTGVKLSAGCLPSMVLFDLSEYERTRRPKIVPLVYPLVMKNSNKNWAPISVGDRLLFVIDFDPLLIVQCDVKSGACTLFHQGKKQHADVGVLRNSSITIPLSEEKHLILLHTKNYIETESYGEVIYYQHRFGIIDLKTGQSKISRPFNVEKSGNPHIEYLSGIMLVGNNILLGYGVGDKEAKSAIIPYKKLEELLA